jgi:transposase InsO family protein
VKFGYNGDNKLPALLASSTALRLGRQQIPGSTVSIYCDTSAGKPWSYVPASLRLQVFQSVHDLSHPGTKTTAKLVAQRFVWPGMQTDCRTWSRVYQACQRSKISRHTVTSVGDFTLPAAHFLHVHIDVVGPLPTSASYTYCLTAVDRFTRWPEGTPLADVTVDTVPNALLTGWIFRFGCPQTIIIDQGRQFESQLFHCLARLCGIQLSRTTAYHPAANGLVERFHRTLKAAIMCHADQQWTEMLPLVLLGIRTSFKADLQASVAELIYGEPLKIPSELLTPTADPVNQRISSHDCGVTWPASDQFRHRTTRPQPLSCTRTFITKRRSLSVRTQYTGLWSPLTTAPTRYSRGERKHCISLCAENQSLCLVTGSSQPTC